VAAALDSTSGKLYIDLNSDGAIDSVIGLTGVTTITEAAFVLNGGAGAGDNGGDGGVEEPLTVAITGAGSTTANDAVVETFDITIGDYAHTIEYFDPAHDLLDFGGDALDLTAADLSIENAADDGMAVLSYTPDAGETIVAITLIGLSSAEDIALTSSAGVDSILA
jgi:hypothetical protein